MDIPTVVIRHRRENLKKCSLSGLEERDDMRFYTYPNDMQALGDLSSYVLLAVDGEPLQKSDAGLLLVDATWRLSEKILLHAGLQNIPRRSIPRGFRTAYPRRQDDCSDPEAGLASIEALFIALTVAGKSTEGLLNGYYWREQFLEKNRGLIEQLTERNKFHII